MTSGRLFEKSLSFGREDVSDVDVCSGLLLRVPAATCQKVSREHLVLCLKDLLYLYPLPKTLVSQS